MTDYVELHARSAYSFLRSASLPKHIALACADLGQSAIALLDRDGVYGAPAFHVTAKKHGIHAIIGAEITMTDGAVCPVLVKSQTGYRNLCRLITLTKMRAQKGEGSATPEEIATHSEGLVCLTGGEDGVFTHALKSNHGNKKELEKRGAWLIDAFGKENVYVELQRHYDRNEEARNKIFVEVAQQLNLPILATNGVCYATRDRRELFDVLTCIREKVTLATAGRLLATNSERYLKSSQQMIELFVDLPEAIENTIELSSRLEFTLKDLGYQFPHYPVPEGETMDSYLRILTLEGAEKRYGCKPLLYERALQQIDHELKLIKTLGLAGYFLIVWDIVEFARKQNILIQGRGSAANSAVCYSLRITAVDPIDMELLFERFLSEERGEWPDIDMDLPSGDQRERVIQYVYEKYGKHGAAMTANVITYRDKSAIRDVGKVLGFPESSIDRLSKLTRIGAWHDPQDTTESRVSKAELDVNDRKIQKFMEIYSSIRKLPRHLGQHSGGMVICAGRLDSIVPIEPASMPNRFVVQWDKDDCANMGIIKIDLLGLGMMAVLEDSITLIKQYHDEDVDLAHLPQNDQRVYSALQQADTIGMFQVESRAQMSSLPRIRPEKFYDIVVQVALIRPGPIVGKMVHPYIRRRQGLEQPDYMLDELKPILKRTLGVPLFQEQLLRMSMVCAGFTGGEAEELRRALGSKRSDEMMDEIEKKLRDGMRKKGIDELIQDKIVLSVASFAEFGFPESHAASFALLAYASAYLKCHYLAVFTAAMLNNYPLGFYSPATLVKDAQRHGLHFKPIDITRSDWLCTIEEYNGGKWLRLGMRYAKGVRQESAMAIMAERRIKAFTGIDDLYQRVPKLRKNEIRTLAEIGALNFIEGNRSDRRSALWQVESAMRSSGPLFEKIVNKQTDSPLPKMSKEELLNTDLTRTGLNIGRHPMSFLRQEMNKIGAIRAVDLSSYRNNQFVTIAGLVIVRQRPGTASGFVFLSMEDETGVMNVIVTPDFFRAHHVELVGYPYLIIEGVLQNYDNVVSVKAGKVIPLISPTASVKSHDFH